MLLLICYSTYWVSKRHEKSVGDSLFDVTLSFSIVLFRNLLSPKKYML
jgi:hypothetical protein